MSILEAVRLTKSYGRRTVVKGLSLKVEPGEILGLFGRNGAGKTTTFQMIAGLVRPDQGTIRIGGHDISPLPTAKRARQGLIYLPQEESVFLKTSVEGNLMMILELLPYSPRERKDLGMRYLEELGLVSLSRQQAHSLSGGERRRLEICRALALKPAFLLLDEPFTGIDPLTIQDLQTIFLRLKKRGIGLILSDHNIRDTFKIADRALIIDGGEVLIEGPPSEVAADERARERFLGKMFRIEDLGPAIASS